MAMLQSLRVGIHLVFTLLLVSKGCRSFFLRHYQTGKCIVPGRNKFNDSLIKTDYAQLGDECLDKKAQFRYQYNEILYNLDTMGVFVAFSSSGNYTEKFYIVSYINGLESFLMKSHVYSLKQTIHGSLYSYRQGFCANVSGIFLDRVMTCDQPEQSQRFTFGSMTNFNDKMEDAHCSPAQLMAIVKAEYGAFRIGDAFKDKYDIDVVCSSFVSRAVKDKCDGNRSCNLNVDRSLLNYSFCPDSTKKLYLEYNCVDINQTVMTTVTNIRLSELPNKGFIEIYDGSMWKMVNEVFWSKQQQQTLCQFLGYEKSGEVSWTKIRSGIEILSGYLYCYDNQSRDVFCSALLYPAASTSDLVIPYVTCNVCDNPLLRDSVRFPDKIFSGLHNIRVLKEARWSNNGWCTRGYNRSSYTNTSMEYILIDLQREYLISHIAILSDKNQTKWLENFRFVYSYTSNFWKEDSIQINGNPNAIRASITKLSIYNVRFIKIIPSRDKDFCLRVELCGHVQLPSPVKSVSIHFYAAYWYAWVVVNLPAKSESSYIRYLHVSINGTGRHKRNVSVNTHHDLFNWWIWFPVLPQTYYTVRVRTADAYTVSEAVNKTFVTSRPVTPLVWSHSWKSLGVHFRTCIFLSHRLNIRYALVVVQAASSTRRRPPDDYKIRDLKPYDTHSNRAYVTAGVESRHSCFFHVLIGDAKWYNISNGAFFNHPLKENTHYVVFVRYYTNESFYSTKWSSSVKTFSKPPAPIITNIVSTKNLSLNISWRQPSLPENQTILNHYVSYRKSGREVTIATGSTEKYYVLSGVKDDEKYYITVQTETNAGRSDPSKKLSSMKGCSMIGCITRAEELTVTKRVTTSYRFIPTILRGQEA